MAQATDLSINMFKSLNKNGFFCALLIAGALAPISLGSSEADTAQPIRVQIGETRLDVPARFKTSILAKREFQESGGGLRKDLEPGTIVSATSLVLDIRAIRKIFADQAEFEQITGLTQISISRGNPLLDHGQVAEGLNASELPGFERRELWGFDWYFAEDPMLFGYRFRMQCSPHVLEKYKHIVERCMIYGRMSDQLAIRLALYVGVKETVEIASWPRDIVTTTWPPLSSASTTWPPLFRAIEEKLERFPIIE